MKSATSARSSRPAPAIAGAPTMKAVVQDAYGSACVLRLAQITRPGFADNEVLPYVHAQEGKLDRKPANATFEQAAVVPVSAVTALQALTDAGRVRPADRVLITGASGGVGSYAAPLAKAFGAEVTGVCSTTQAELVRSLGADHVIDYTKDDFANGTHHYGLILDIAGNPGLSRLRRALAPAGTAVIIGGEEGGRWTGGIGRRLQALALSPFLRQRLTMVTARQRFSDLERLTSLIETGMMTPSIDRTYPLDQVTDAIRRLAAGQARGKVAVTTGTASLSGPVSGSTRSEGASA
jgi:NADPH:quinone reductase-like Zn-dependent oxidoreductase